VILSEDYLQGLLDEALEHVNAGPDAAIVLEGSIAEGFGNESSDIDFVIVEPSSEALTTMPTLLFLDGRRVEVRTRSLTDVANEAAALTVRASEGRAGVVTLSYNDLDRWQRLAGAYPLRNKERVATIKALLPPREIERLVGNWFAELARTSGRCAVALTTLGQRREAINWAQTALDQAAKSWLARHGETYIGLKWLSQQFARIKGHENSYQQYQRLASPVPDAVKIEDYVADCSAFVTELGVDGCEYEPHLVVLQLSRNVTSWQIADRLYVVKDRGEVFALETQAAATWRSLAFGIPIADVLQRNHAAPDQARNFIAQFHRFGLLKLHWHQDDEISARGTVSAAPTFGLPLLTPAGTLGTDGIGLELLPLTATRFAAAGMALVWANVEVENSREDADGALANGQWAVLEAATRRMVRKAAVVILSSYGIVSLGSSGSETGGSVGGSSWQRREADEEACSRLAAIPDLPESIAAALIGLEAVTGIRDEADARRLLGEVDNAIAQVRALIGASAFPSSFRSASGWRKTVELGYDWIRLGAHLDSTFPVDEAREVLAGGTG
jgi:hypothetical protein